MKRLFYKYVPAIFFIAGLFIWFLDFLLDHLVTNDLLVWSVFLILILSICVLCGVLIQRLHEGAYNDILTGLRNRRYFYEKLTEELARAKRTGSTITLALIDVDKFKDINDEFGHVVGDNVLVNMANILRGNSRTVATTARWGGEEFTIILPETDVECAYIFAERLRNTVQNSDGLYNATISIGLATTNGDVSLDQFIMQADDALYKAKVKRNTVVHYSPLQQQGIQLTLA